MITFLGRDDKPVSKWPAYDSGQSQPRCLLHIRIVSVSSYMTCYSQEIISLLTLCGRLSLTFTNHLCKSNTINTVEVSRQFASKPNFDQPMHGLDNSWYSQFKSQLKQQNIHNFMSHTSAN